MESGNKKHRYTYSGGVKAVENSKWGHNVAVERYGQQPNPNMRPKDQSQPQSPEDKHGPGYRNDVANDWGRGFGKGGHAVSESAEGKPGYVPGYKGGKR
jgi:hypothetical protein